MTSKKKELEIVYNLEWKNKPANGDEKSNMVGILDIPATTLDWKTFKSYLLKNSGAADDNVKVSYIDSEDREKAINSQLDFEIALYTFRHKARMNEIITLKLDCINSKKSTTSVKSIAKGLSEVQLKRKTIKKMEEPPEWFLIYMKKFKEELLEEISTMYSSKAHQMNLYHTRKLKADSYKRTRKTPLLLGEAINDKELSKSAKMERKLESKLEKLEHKTMKIKAKKMALRGSSDSDVGRSSGKNETLTYLPPNSNNDMSMNASVIKKDITPHMIGGEPYCQTWDICNSGTLPWTSNTELRYAWGSQALKPINKEVPCPPLQPGEKGSISVFLEIPKTPGTYECYWHFYHNGRRFGHWLGCEIIVDEPPVKNVPYIPSPTYDVINIQDVYELVLPTSWTTPKKTDEILENNPDDIENPFAENERRNYTTFPLTMFDDNQSFIGQKKEEEVKDLVDGKDEILQQETKPEVNPFSDSDNQSIVSISDSSVHSATSEDFVMLKMSSTSPKLEKDVSALEFTTAVPNISKINASSMENIDNIDNLFTRLSVEEINSADLKIDHAVPVKKEEADTSEDSLVANEQESSTKNISTTTNVVQQIPIDLSNKSVATDTENGTTEDKTGYAYIQYKGRKIPISKKHLSPEYLVTAESVPESEVKNLEKFKIEEVIKSEEEPVKDTGESSFRTSTPSFDMNGIISQDQEIKTNECNQQANSCCFTLPTATTESCNNSCSVGASMTSSTNDNRFFVFPQFYPGYEVVPPTGTNYVEDSGPNAMPFQQVYQSNSVNGVLVNDWSTGLNYTACVWYPTPTQYYSSTNGVNTPNTSRGCSSVPNSAGGTPPNQSPQSFQDGFSYKVESPVTNFCNVHCKSEQNVNINSSFEDVQNNVHTNSASSYSSENVANSVASNQTRQSPDARVNRVGVPDLLSGATVVATSAINTARSVLNMFVPPRNTDCGRWQNGHWISTNPESKREKNLRLLYEMGFYNRDLNATLLARYHDDINLVISDLLE